MIWLDGELAADGRVAIPLGDPFLDHGLGLFETFRTWSGVAVLLDRQLDRLRASASALEIDLAEVRLPDRDAVEALTAAHGRPDALLRLTVTAGRPPAIRPTAWMTCSPLPPPAPSGGYRVVDAAWTVDPADALARHKTTNYWGRRLAHERATAAGFDEAMFRSADGRAWEGSRTSLFLVSGRTLLTPPITGPIIPGVMRSVILERAAGVGFATREEDIRPESVARADEVFLANSVRGLIPVRKWFDRAYRPTDPTFPVTTRLRDDLINPRTGPRS